MRRQEEEERQRRKDGVKEKSSLLTFVYLQGLVSAWHRVGAQFMYVEW